MAYVEVVINEIMTQMQEEIFLKNFSEKEKTALVLILWRMFYAGVEREAYRRDLQDVSK